MYEGIKRCWCETYLAHESMKLTFTIKMRHYESNFNLPEPSFEILGNRQHLFLGFTSLGKDLDIEMMYYEKTIATTSDIEQSRMTITCGIKTVSKSL